MEANALLVSVVPGAVTADASMVSSLPHPTSTGSPSQRVLGRDNFPVLPDTNILDAGPPALKRSAWQAHGECPMDMIIFARRVYYGVESDLHVNITVLRLGTCEGTSRVRFSTKGSDAKEGEDFIAVKGQELTFAPGETHQVVEVKLVDDHRWEGCESFQVNLTEPECAQLGPLSQATVTIADDDIYPRGGCNTTSQKLRGFVKEQIALRGWNFWATFLALAYMAVFGVIDSYILKLVIDNASGGKADFGTEVRDEKMSFILAFAYLCFFAVDHYADVAQMDYRGRSGTRKWLRNTLVAKYLNLSEPGTAGLSDGDFINCVIFQVEQLVVDGWYQFLLCLQYTVLLLSNVALQCYLFNNKIPIWVLFLVFIVFPPAMTAVLACREERQLKLINIRQDAEDAWVNEVTDLVASRQLIGVFHAVDKVSAHFKKTYEDFYKKHRAARFYEQTSKWIPRWGFAIVLCTLYALAPVLVDTFNLSAGDFAAMIKSWLKLEKGAEKMYISLLKFRRSFVALEKIADVLNRETKFHERHETHNKQKQHGQTACTFNEESFEGSGSVCFLEEIRIVRATFTYKSKAYGHKPLDILKEADVTIPLRGSIISLSNKVSNGNRTILRLLAGLIHPSSGVIVVPPHKKTILVDRNPILVKGTILRNLRFGCDDDISNGSRSDEICWAVAQVVGLSKDLCGNDTFIIQNAGLDQFSTEDRTALAISQALLAEPGILCVDHAGDARGAEFVRGVLLPLFRRYIQSGLQGVLSGEECSKRVQPPKFRPSVIWNSFVLSPKDADQVIGLENGKMSVGPSTSPTELDGGLLTLEALC